MYAIAAGFAVILCGTVMMAIRRGRSQAVLDARLRAYCCRSLIESRLEAVCRAR